MRAARGDVATSRRTPTRREVEPDVATTPARAQRSRSLGLLSPATGARQAQADGVRAAAVPSRRRAIRRAASDR
ncbi:hypothetical protein ABZX74_05070 [Streptomyces olivaceoviridis]|uniref:hypothetical protein n=1 Tax=Streptomyces olivaceoviridis TaxID=1921 RepID=UPI0033A12965